MLYVLDRDNAIRTVPRSVLRQQYLQGNLSERIQISADGDNFEPLETAAWFLSDDATISTVASTNTPAVCS